MTSVGDILRNAREEQGRTTSEIARELCILQRYVAAIESGDVANLPGLFFYKSFVRQYAAILALDKKSILPQLEALSAAVEPSPRPDIRVLDPLVEQANRRFIPDIPLSWSVAGLAAVVLLCSGFYAWWTRTPARAAATEAVRLVNPPVPAATAVDSQTPASARTPSNTPPPAETPAAADAQATPAKPVEARPIANSEPKVLSGEALSGIVLKFSATERTWLSISSGGREVFSGILEPSESKTLTGLDTGTIKVGNAAGISVHLNGKPIGPLGQRGQVLTIRFTSQDFEILPPKEQL